MIDEHEALAKRRFFVLGLVRISGAVMLLFGMAIISNGLLDLPKPVGFAALAIGVVDFILMPLILARRWKSPPPT